MCMISRRKLKITVLVEWKHLGSNFMKALEENMSHFFEDNLLKTFYVLKFGDINVTNHRINCENQMMVEVECHAVIFEPKLGILSMTVEDIDKKDNFVVFNYDKVKDFKVFVTPTQNVDDLKVGETHRIEIQILKNHKTNLIAIGCFL